MARNGFDVRDNHEATDAIVINTCGFVEEAKNESLEAIMQAIQKKSEGKTKRVVITVRSLFYSSTHAPFAHWSVTRRLVVA